MLRCPTRCPYCYSPVDTIRPYNVQVPPDERETSPQGTIALTAEASTPKPIQFDVMDCRKLKPCGHIFQKEHIEQYGEQKLSGDDLAVRVVNPKQDP